jgi:hypothetical protein
MPEPSADERDAIETFIFVTLTKMKALYEADVRDDDAPT